MNNNNIVQFVPMCPASSLISENSTFCLRSLRYYKLIEDGNLVGDRRESMVVLSNRHSELGGTTLVSCWTQLKGDLVSGDDWNLSPHGKNVVAIISTIDKVSTVLEKAAEGLLKNWRFEHKPVQYYDEHTAPNDSNISELPFWKRNTYRTQREYRFAFRSDSSKSHLQTLIFYVPEPQGYIDKIQFGPEMRMEDIERLFGQAVTGNLGNRIHDFDAILAKIQQHMAC
jgi:hypothetical protein